MSANADSPGKNSYKLTCTDCGFETTVEGDALDALDVADEHQTENGRVSGTHFVNLELCDRK